MLQINPGSNHYRIRALLDIHRLSQIKSGCTVSSEIQISPQE